MTVIQVPSDGVSHATIAVAVLLGVAFALAAVTTWNLVGQLLNLLRGGLNEAELMPLMGLGSRLRRQGEGHLDDDTAHIPLLGDDEGEEEHLHGLTRADEAPEQMDAAPAAAPETAQATPVSGAVAALVALEAET